VPGLVITEAAWQAAAAAQNGFCPNYSDGDGSTTFRAPFYGRYFGAAVTDEEANTWAGDAIRNITGSFQPGRNGIVYTGVALAQGAFIADNEYSSSTVYSGGTLSIPTRLNLDASRVVPTASENRPKTCYLNVYIHAHDVAAPLSEAQTQEILNALNGKLGQDDLGPFADFSAEEKFIGRYWIDGKKIYRKAEPGDVPGSFYYPTNEPCAWRWDGAAWAKVTAEEQAAARRAEIMAELDEIDRAAQLRAELRGLEGEA
jgi:hypothetical protein